MIVVDVLPALIKISLQRIQGKWHSTDIVFLADQGSVKCIFFRLSTHFQPSHVQNALR